MPRGFIGRPATIYLTEASTAQSRAQEAGTRVAENAPSNTSMRTRNLPFEPAEGIRGGFVSTGRGNSSNIVVSQGEYEAIAQRISQADHNIGACIYNVIGEIETLCQTSFILPDAVPRCLNISDSVKKSLNEFREITEEAVIKARNFARAIDDIG